MNNFNLVLGLGFLMGLRHALDSDHLVAMSTLISRARLRGVSWLLGACWGVGHTVTILAVGAAIIVLKLNIPKGLSSALEFSVGVMLAILGAMNLAGMRLGGWAITEHTHQHFHDDHEHHVHFWPGAKENIHDHPHYHSVELEALVRRVGRFQLLRSLAVGMVHGLAGSTAVALLVLTAIPGAWEGMVYLLVFGIGSVASMAILSAIFELVIRRTLHSVRIDRWLVPATGMMSLVFGLYIMYQFGWAKG